VRIGVKRQLPVLISSALFAVQMAAAQAQLPELSYGCQRGTGEALIRGCTEDIRRNPKEIQAYYNRAIEYLLTQNFDAAIADLTRVIELSPRKNSAHFVNRGGAYLGKGDEARALADFDAAIAIFPGAASAYEGRGVVYERKGDREQAIFNYRTAISLSAGMVEAKRGLKRMGVD
jgi:tetratricopeptide (TPR) repeat protein